MRYLAPVAITATLAGIAYLAYGALAQSGEDKESLPSTSPQGTSSQSSEETRSKARTPHLVALLRDPTKHLDEHIEAIRTLPSDLTDREFEALIDLCYQEPPSEIAPHIWTTIQNEVMEVLRHRRFDLPGYAPAMAQLVTAKEADPVMRDYAAQHLVGYLNSRATTLPEDQVSSSLEALITVLDGEREAQAQVTGTTLMALCDFHSRHPDLLVPHRSQLLASVDHLLRAEHSASLPNRISAIQAAGRLGFPEILPTIRQLAMSSEESSQVNGSIRLSSVAALGYFADAQDRAFLEQLAASSSAHRFAALTALKNYP